MNEMNKRFKDLRLLCDKNQEEWGKILGLTKSGVSDIERGKRNVTEQHLIMLQNWKEHPVNIDWIRSGKGEPFKALQKDDALALCVSELLEDSENPFYDLILDIIRAYIELSPKSQEIIKNAIVLLQKQIAEKKES